MASQANKTDSLTKGDLDKIGGLLDDRLAPMATKEFVKDFVGGEINSLESNLKAYMHEGFEAVMAGMDNLAEQLAEKEKIERLVEWAKKVSKKTGVQINI